MQESEVAQLRQLLREAEKQAEQERSRAEEADKCAEQEPQHAEDEIIFENHTNTKRKLVAIVGREQASAAVEMHFSNGPLKRPGIPYTIDHERDRLPLFLDKLDNTDKEQYDEISSFFIRKSFYFAFFSKPSRPTPRSHKEMSQLDTSLSAHLGDDQARQEQERLAREEQERLVDNR